MWVIVSANKQRDDDCQGVIQVASLSCHPSALFLSSQCPYNVIPVRDTGISFYFMMMS
ncbi:MULTISPECIES: hypothetical protein [Wolbachia]|uniref:hypothetical protein n=1 Tax=Wolbachia TaxID=953 RepID=UPI000FEFDF89|nr:MULTISPECIES: hypothetical protein [Wolbachia]MDX5596500.1 hypothetical protein [Wolbachia endosymbiont of Andrena labialis]MBA8766736.1 hypothetical protein [Wolbachia pipientis]RLT61962.1 hypothetical protein WANA34_0777 [Wolbachia endosymbiont of Drosophila ananassae]RLT61978.1 hypothetical protein WANA31_0709 [Wolbachia endosymbiont of Drosophila ananassae]RLT62057.1 hypothetical protein WANA13_1263 [Wolbachia endosymbiont of Drosophila ananassae]